MWANIHDFLAKSDFVFGNLESPTSEKNTYSLEKNMIFDAPPELIRTLPGAGFGVVNLANNHILDQKE